MILLRILLLCATVFCVDQNTRRGVRDLNDGDASIQPEHVSSRNRPMARVYHQCPCSDHPNVSCLPRSIAYQRVAEAQTANHYNRLYQRQLEEYQSEIEERNHVNDGEARVIKRNKFAKRERAIASEELNQFRRHKSQRARTMENYRRQQEQYRKEVQSQNDRYYEEYFDRMREYGRNLQRKKYMELMQKQADERGQIAQQMRYWHATDGIMASKEESADEDTPVERPVDPFAKSSPHGDGVRTKGQRSAAAAASTTLPRFPPSEMAPKPGMEDSHKQAVALQGLCQKFMPTVRKHCVKGHIEKAYEKKCAGYYQDCQQFIQPADPLYSIAHSFDSGVNLNLGTWAVKGIPYYPINEEGAIGAGRQMNIPFGAWGGGYSDNIGVRDYWNQYQEVGANWYDGKYGYKSGWSVPLVQSLGIEGDTHATVSVPIKQGELGKPIGVDVGGGVGPYYQQNTHVGVDYLHGNVGYNFGVGVPMAGVGVNTGVGVSFPGVDDIVG